MGTHKKIVSFLRKNSPSTQAEIARNLPKMNRAVLLGYLRALVDLGVIKSKNSGKAKVYYL